MFIKVGNKIVDSHELQTAEMQQWLAQLHKQEVEIQCTCNPNATMHIRRSPKGKYTIKSNPNRLLEHDATICDIYLDLSDKQMRGQHYRAIEEISDTELSISTKHLGIFIREKKADDKQPRTSAINLSKAAVTNSGITLGSLGRELLSRAWEHSILNFQKDRKYYPSIRAIQYQLSTLFLQEGVRVTLSDKLQLKDVLWIGNKKPISVYAINKSKKIAPIVLCPLEKDAVRPSPHEGYMEITGKCPKGNDIAFIVNTSNWDMATKHCRVSYAEHKHFFMIGVAFYDWDKNAILLERMELIPVTKRGMFIDSSFENRLFNRFELDQRIYKRPNQRMPELDGYLPDAILLDTAKPCIVEVFGMSESQLAYHESKDRKIKYYSTLPNYSTYYWHAYRGKGYPPLPRKFTAQ